MSEDSSFNPPRLVDPGLIEFVVEMVSLDRKVIEGDEEGLQAAHSILKKAESLKHNAEE